MLNPNSPEYFMREAMREAKLASENKEVPVGAVVICNNKIIARGRNMTEQLNDVTAHAEMIALTAAAEQLGSKYLADCTLYVSLEPCPMCAAALGWSQIGKIVFAASDEKRGAHLFQPSLYHPKTIIEQDMSFEENSGGLLKAFFNEKRRN
jgi:tRNA(adenine34) deaminase